jgi:hypothetical protein
MRPDEPASCLDYSGVAQIERGENETRTRTTTPITPIACQSLGHGVPGAYLLAGAAGGLVLSEPMAEAAPDGGLAMPDGVLVSAGGVDGMVDVVDGDVAGGLMGAGVDASSAFLPHAPSASSAESATAVAAGLNGTEYMAIPSRKWMERDTNDSVIYRNGRSFLMRRWLGAL